MKKEIKPFLTVSHYIYLSREQRHSLFSGEYLEVVGVSVPVWFKLGNTSEPAKEVFCKYVFSNEITSSGFEPTKEGYKINLNIFNPKINMMSILDVPEKGCEELITKGYTKFVQEGKIFSAFHCLEIKSIELLTSTLS